MAVVVMTPTVVFNTDCELLNQTVNIASVTFRMVNEIVAPAASNRRARRRSKRSSKPSFPSMERGLVGVTMTDCDLDSIEESR
ncbi:hypothetical protein ALC53_05654 [Atta colombica]|uniref:Uncharacterized protein n=1 Tax=Atta colombica TaxID=520822 RepID=A0A151I3X5_9HYME|nr:hypothetical protein ALC53_05654 [Atta colombica]